MKGVLTLENEIRGAHTRLIKLRDSGRLGNASKARDITRRLESTLKLASLLSGLLRQYEVGRDINGKETGTST